MSRTVPTLLDHITVAVMLAIVLTVMEEIVQVYPYICSQLSDPKGRNCTGISVHEYVIYIVNFKFCIQTLMNVPLTMEAAHKIAQTMLGLLLVVAILDTHYSVME